MDEKNVLRKFRAKKVFTIEPLICLLKCSIITARRRLKKWKTHTSINKNGRYYVLPEIAVLTTMVYGNTGVLSFQGMGI